MDTEEKQQNTRWMLYIPKAMLATFRKLAAEHRRSVNSEMLWALEQYLAQQERSHAEQKDL